MELLTDDLRLYEDLLKAVHDEMFKMWQQGLFDDRTAKDAKISVLQAIGLTFDMDVSIK